MEYIAAAAGVALVLCVIFSVIAIVSRLKNNGGDLVEELVEAIQCAVGGKSPEVAVAIARQMAPGYRVFVQHLQPGYPVDIHEDLNKAIYLGVNHLNHVKTTTIQDGDKVVESGKQCA